MWIINKALENIGENINILAEEILGYCEVKQHKPSFDEVCSEV
jgi:hypothetical protein